MASYREMVKKYWQIFDEARFDDVADLLHPDCRVYWPNTRELFRGRDRLINVNKRYPGRWHIDVIDIIDQNDSVISVVRVYSNESKHSFYATSFFKFRNGLVTEITEYWGDITEPPAWRITEKY
jgi:ketosteroid isomerase-like protein